MSFVFLTGVSIVLFICVIYPSFFKTKTCRYAHLILVLRPHTLSSFSKILPAAWKRCQYTVLEVLIITKKHCIYLYVIFICFCVHCKVIKFCLLIWCDRIFALIWCLNSFFYNVFFLCVLVLFLYFYNLLLFTVLF